MVIALGQLYLMKAPTSLIKTHHWVIRNCAGIFRARELVKEDLLFVTLVLQYCVRKLLFRGQDQLLTLSRY